MRKKITVKDLQSFIQNELKDKRQYIFETYVLEKECKSIADANAYSNITRAVDNYLNTRYENVQHPDFTRKNIQAWTQQDMMEGSYYNVIRNKMIQKAQSIRNKMIQKAQSIARWELRL